MSQLTISGYSTALFSTYYFVEELGILFDAGDGVMSNLMQKSRKVKHIFISHADRDHLAGLLQFMQLNGRDGFPKVYFPKDCGSFPALAEFASKFDPHTGRGEWIGLDRNEEVWIKKDLVVKAIENRHVPTTGDQLKSLTYQVFRVKRKLKEAYLSLSGQEIASLRKAKGNDAVTTAFRTNILSFSGDTPIENDGRWQDTQVLIHEATFLDKTAMDTEDPRYNKHSTLAEVMEMAAKTNLGQLILGHFSTRYKEAEIRAEVDRLTKLHQVDVPIKLVLPGQFVFDILNS